MENLIVTRPLISTETENSYVLNFLKVGYYFIQKFPKFFGKINKTAADSFQMQLSSKIYDNPFIPEESNFDTTFMHAVCLTMFVGRNSEKFDVHISVEIVNKPSIGIALMHKRSWGKNQVTIYFFDHSQGVKMPGDKEIDYDPSVLNGRAQSFFMKTIGFCSERTTTLEDGLDTIERILNKMESVES